MKVIKNRFLTWLLGLTRISRYFVIALLFHTGLLVLLGSIKLVTTVIRPGQPLPRDPGVELDTQVTGEQEFTGLQPAGIPTGSPGRAPAGGGLSGGTGDALMPVPGIPAAASGRERFGVPDIAGVIPAGTGGNSALNPTFTSAQPGGRIGWGIPGGELFESRNPDDRDKILKQLPGGDAVARAVTGALRYLQTIQRADGSWACAQSDVAGTALAMLAFLGHGQTTDSAEFGDTVARGMSYLVNAVGANGLVRGQNMYAQGITTLALAEGHAMMRGPYLREPLERAVSAIVRSQKLAKLNALHTGGWRYSAAANDADLSVSGWIIMALKSAGAAGVEVPTEAMAMAESYLWQMHSPTGFGYSTPSATPNMTAVGVLCLQFLGQGDDPRLKGAMSLLRKQKFDWENSNKGFAMYGWYYTTQALFQSGGDAWISWNNQMRDTLVKRQREDGSWPAPDASDEAKTFAQSPVYPTAMSALMLEVYYRYRPMYLLKQKPGSRILQQSGVTPVAFNK